MKLLNVVRAKLNAALESASFFMGAFESKPEDFRLLTLGYEIKDMNHDAKSDWVPVRVTKKTRSADDKLADRVRVLVIVQQEQAYPAERKIAMNIDLSSNDAFETGITTLKGTFAAEARKIKPGFGQGRYAQASESDAPTSFEDGPR